MRSIVIESTRVRASGIACAVLMVIGLAACSDSGATGRCTTDDDCTRRELCIDQTCVAISDLDVTDTTGDTSPDTSDVDDTNGDTSLPDTTLPDTADSNVDSDDTGELDTRPDVPMDPCQGICAPDELCGWGGKCYCTPGLKRLCGTKIGKCGQGYRTCRDGDWGECEAIPVNEPEICDRIDNDCDGLTDEDACFPPIAVCPPAQSVHINEVATLSGEGRDPDGGTVTFDWEVISGPVGGSTGPIPFDEAVSSLAPDDYGVWALSMCVDDDEGVRACCETEVRVIEPCVPPAVPVISTCGTSWDRRPILQFPALPAGLSYDLRMEGAPLATITGLGQNYYRPPEALQIGGPPPLGVSAVFEMNACRVDDPTCCSPTSSIEVAMIEACTTPIPPTSSNIIFSEYLINGDGGPSSCVGPNCQAGEALEITNLSNCPVSLDGYHFRYCNNNACSSAKRYKNFGPADIIPPRGVYVTIRNPAKSTCGFDFMPTADTPDIFGIRRSTLELLVDGSFSNDSGWFLNGGGSFRFASGAYSGPFGGTTLVLIDDYIANSPACESIGFDALGACGDIPSNVTPTQRLRKNQLGRLWHPCDALIAPNPAQCFDR
ncbi:MAG: lamin tail domain-containing protein [Deltaproteobacteria bacterium]|nr:lamin tail domain-containing protein [Deltaproteobacteria bacterium]